MSNKLESITKELSQVKRQNTDLEEEVKRLEKQINDLNTLCKSNTNNESINSFNQNLEIFEKKPSICESDKKYSNTL